jgi:hypothetical protein
MEISRSDWQEKRNSSKQRSKQGKNRAGPDWLSGIAPISFFIPLLFQFDVAFSLDVAPGRLPSRTRFVLASEHLSGSSVVTHRNRWRTE